MERYEWDEGNTDHVALHGVTRTDCEAALSDRHRLPVPAYPGPNGEERWAFVGVAPAGRILRVVYTVRGAHYRVVTAHRASRSERRQYLATVPPEPEEDVDD